MKYYFINLEMLMVFGRRGNYKFVLYKRSKSAPLICCTIVAPTTPFLRVESSCRGILLGARATSCETSERGYQYGTESTTHWRCVATFRGLSFSSPLFPSRCGYRAVSFCLDFLWLPSVVESTGGKTGFRNKFSFAHAVLFCGERCY